MKKKKKKKEGKPFLAASKLIGIIVGFLSATVIVYAMTLMAVTNNLDALPTLIGGAFGLAGTYVGFYILMAKAEHIEDKKNEIQKELKQIRKDGITQQEYERETKLEEDLIEIEEKLDELDDEEINTPIV